MLTQLHVVEVKRAVVVVLVGSGDVVIERSAGGRYDVEHLPLHGLHKETASSGSAQAGRERQPVGHLRRVAVNGIDGRAHVVKDGASLGKLRSGKAPGLGHLFDERPRRGRFGEIVVHHGDIKGIRVDRHGGTSRPCFMKVALATFGSFVPALEFVQPVS